MPGGGEDTRPAHSGVKLTFDDYMRFPEDGQRHELIDGEHYVSIKRRLYQRFGVDEYWIAEPDTKTVSVFRRQGHWLRVAAELSLERGDVLTTPLLPGLELPLKTIFD